MKEIYRAVVDKFDHSFIIQNILCAMILLSMKTLVLSIKDYNTGQFSRDFFLSIYLYTASLFAHFRRHYSYYAVNINRWHCSYEQ